MGLCPPLRPQAPGSPGQAQKQQESPWPSTSTWPCTRGPHHHRHHGVTAAPLPCPVSPAQPPPGPSPAGSPRRCVGSRASTAPGGRAGTGRRGRAPSASAPRAHGSGPGARTPGTAPSGTCGRGRGGDLLLPPPSPCPFTVASPACFAVDAAALPASTTRAGVAGAAEGPLDALHAAGTQALAPGRPRGPAAAHCGHRVG